MAAAVITQVQLIQPNVEAARMVMTAEVATVATAVMVVTVRLRAGVEAEVTGVLTAILTEAAEEGANT